jgi:hypothetical protein
MSGFHRDVDGIFVLLGYYTALSGSSIPTFRDNLSCPTLSVKKSKTVEDETYSFSRNVGT